MTSSRALLTMGLETRKIAGLLPGLQDRRLFFSFGDVIPDLSGFDVSYWAAGIWGARLQRVGLATQVCSPGAGWMPQLPQELTGRRITNGTLKALLDQERPRKTVWVKPAEAKIPAFQPGLYAPADVADLFAAEEIGGAVELQWTDAVVQFDFEHRFFILDGEIATGSPYRVGAVLGYYESISWERFTEAQRFAEHVLSELAGADLLPPHFTLDVGWDVQHERWLIVEGNRSWSSGIYGSDSVAALAAIDAATHYAGTRWRWQPDSEVVRRAAEMPLLEVVPVGAETIGFIEYQR